MGGSGAMFTVLFKNKSKDMDYLDSPTFESEVDWQYFARLSKKTGLGCQCST